MRVSASAMDSVAVDSSANITIGSTAAVLQLVLSNSYNPVYGDSWVLFSGNTNLISGMFNLTNAILPVLGGGNSWALTSDGSNWNVGVGPEPSTFTLLGIAGLTVLFLRRRKG